MYVYKTNIWGLGPFRPGRIFLSINRFDFKKNIALAVLAFSKYTELNESDEDDILIISGGYDSRLRGNVQMLFELQKLSDSLYCLLCVTLLSRLAKELSLTHRIVFLTSITSDEKHLLLSNCMCVLYTPEREHFGIVPLEAMQYQKPVIACRSGGPMETVIHGITGFLCQSCPNVRNI